ncbi:MAG TPA: RNase adapter RapZ [Thermodesulfobacteriota bacterium]|nr:RNase adapter RapZ [Thermodesulfobacteriota bacterium]
MRLVVLSGPSGSGKSTAVKALEDLGFFCVDNMPVTLLPKFMELLASGGEISRVAAVVDVREREFLKSFGSVFSVLKEEGCAVELVYLDASDESLVRRFSETRRRHPLADTDSPLEGILKERELLKEVKAHADRVVDTTNFNVHQLREVIKELFAGPVSSEKMTVTLVSFGYRYGIPTDADLVIDIRFLPNPFFVNALKGLDGTDERVREYVLGREETTEFLKRFTDLLEYLIPLYWKEGKSYLTVAVGCTGGKHRSVVVVEELASKVLSGMTVTRKRHRDIFKT